MSESGYTLEEIDKLDPETDRIRSMVNIVHKYTELMKEARELAEKGIPITQGMAMQIIETRRFMRYM